MMQIAYRVIDVFGNILAHYTKVSGIEITETVNGHWVEVKYKNGTNSAMKVPEGSSIAEVLVPESNFAS